MRIHAYNRYRKSGTQENLKKFQDLRKTTQKETRRSYRKYINSICMDSSKKFWSSVKCLKQDAMGIPTLKKNGVFESDNTVKATVLNNHFKSVFTQEDDILPQLPPTSTPPSPILLFRFLASPNYSPISTRTKPLALTVSLLEFSRLLLRK